MKKNYPCLEIKGIKDEKDLTAVRSLPRELFISQSMKEMAYVDSALPIECGQTISQPFIVAYMTEQLDLKPYDKVLEIGTGSGFQTGVLAQLAKQVWTIEFYEKLSKKANEILSNLKFKNIHYKVGDGKEGWEEFAPFDKIIITALADKIPTQLIDQLKIGGRMILPLKVGEDEEYLFLVKKIAKDEIEKEKLIQVRFVPLL